jgi:hypothetical protein
MILLQCSLTTPHFYASRLKQSCIPPESLYVSQNSVSNASKARYHIHNYVNHWINVLQRCTYQICPMCPILEACLFNDYIEDAHLDGRAVARCKICCKVSSTKSNLRKTENA